MSYAKLVDVTRCDACRACQVACKNWNDLPMDVSEYGGSYQSHEKVNGKTWNVLQMKEYENGSGFEWLFRHSACFHCEDAACEKVCPEGAISTTDMGSVVIDQEKCVGCSYCVQNCPFDIVELAEYTNGDGETVERAQKCTMCDDRIHNGLQPACADICHMDAIVFGTKEEMKELAQKRLAQVQDRYPNAQIYDPEGVGGTHTFYLLAEEPEAYDLPRDPKVPTSAVVWKDYAQPMGKALLGVTTMAVMTGYVTNKLFNKEGHGSEEEGGHDDVDRD
ncbi:4Fe-4S dicluster domain-containing protein [Salisediminibacterium beveridgei]|uniref:Formate dehydrogenase O beta subunit n=1 Tax=Salisediminibacterium beveridgei TaxID=632773 RepID=A0A1D7QSU8_9BACI|nr:4Fe-4S dicluster domain-containing protein [Salisediminibacterium beveridgei]AOM82090.1 Formate dehydrogenase O beta subunit [Salisediminibacterium beveridgei]